MNSCSSILKRAGILVLCLLLLPRTIPAIAAEEETTDLTLASASCLLMEGSTGTILYEKNSHEVLPPASITKIMTMLLIYEAVEAESIHWEDPVTVSEHAASMGGSQVFLEPGETQTVETMLKCISIASANDACVAMAEHISGSEEAFVRRMNLRAKELGMSDTVFVNCCGLDTDGHVSSAYDVALMSRELICRYPEVSRYATTWMDTITHTTRKGQSEFGLTNTNKLVRQFDGITGLKTGSTGKAKYCLSATAEREEITMIAVVMAAPDTKTRFREAAKLMNYGFACCTRYVDEHTDFSETRLRLSGGLSDSVRVEPAQPFFCLLLRGEQAEQLTEKTVLPDKVTAPLKKGDEVGRIYYYKDGTEIGSVAIVCTEEVRRATFADYLWKVLKILT